MIPESIEVTEQKATSLTKLWLAAQQTDNPELITKFEDFLVRVMSASDCGVSVAFILADHIVTPLLEIELPEGSSREISFEYGDNEPQTYELLLERFLNAVLHIDLTQARETYAALVEDEAEESLPLFFNLLIDLFWAST